MTIRGTLLAGLLAVTFALPALAASVGAVALQSGRTCSLSERWPVGDPIRVCAILVEFQEDSIEGTTGTGRIGTGFDSSLVIDPLPHDREYFRDHLRFLRHYYETVSRGGVVFDTTMMDVFPLIEGSAYRLDYPMWHYNYNSDAELLNRRLVELFIESCAKASEDPELDFTRYNAILVFHAGVGKDFNLGYDPTPFDIPSAYISARDVQSYSGSIQIPGGVERGLILPEGENQREALDYDVELSLNGIMVKLFGNWLGLPDLFDTRTGHSGVGRWGMMDQGSGNMSALVPSLPTAWSRVYMEWQAAAVHLPSGRGDTLHVARFGRGGDVAQIVKIPVTAREYYVIENRDADADSVKCVTLWDRDSLHVMHVYYEERTQAREGFLLSRDRRIEYQPGFGVAVGASHYDFGIPGSGLLIWHIDEDVIVRGLDDNTVNADPDHRGVDLVEADGAQDIGREYGFASAGSGTELGIQEDAWYLNNSQHRAANRGANYELFADYSFPAARIYDGSYTRLRLSNFSAVDSVMSFVCRMEGVADGFPVQVPDLSEWTVADLDGDSLREIYFILRDSLYQISHQGVLSVVASLPAGVGLYSTDPVDVDGDGRDEILLEGAYIGLVDWSGTDPRVRWEITSEWSSRAFPAQSDSADGRGLLVWRTRSNYVATLYDAELVRLSERDLPFLADDSVAVFNLESFPAHRFVFVTDGLAVCYSVGDTTMDSLWSIADERLSHSILVVVRPDTTAVFFDGMGYVNAATGTSLCEHPSCGPPGIDWDGNGIPDGGGWLGRNAVEREDAPRIGAPLTWTLDLNASGDPDIMGLDAPVFDSTSESSLYTRVIAVSHNGGAFRGFPWAVSGVESSHTPFEWTNDRSLYVMRLTSVGDDLYFSPIRLLDAHGDSRFHYTESRAIINVPLFNPRVTTRADWLYCWPNPTSDISHFRITVGYIARAEIKVFDLAGRLIARLSHQSAIPEPFEVMWDVGGVESGVYVGRVRVSGSGGDLESQVKIAVVK